VTRDSDTVLRREGESIASLSEASPSLRGDEHAGNACQLEQPELGLPWLIPAHPLWGSGVITKVQARHPTDLSSRDLSRAHCTLESEQRPESTNRNQLWQ
jgi:hypothetical protein